MVNGSCSKLTTACVPGFRGFNAALYAANLGNKYVTLDESKLGGDVKDAQVSIYIRRGENETRGSQVLTSFSLFPLHLDFCRRRRR